MLETYVDQSLELGDTGRDHGASHVTETNPNPGQRGTTEVTQVQTTEQVT